MPEQDFYRSHLENDVMTWWLANGPDTEYGGVRTCFANSGDTLVSTDKYTWSQGRWAWLTARLAGVFGPGALLYGVVLAEYLVVRPAQTTAAQAARQGPARPHPVDARGCPDWY